MSKPASAPEPRCPICRKPSVEAHAPFCSAACRDRDLLAWLDERYVVPGKALNEDEG
ncbi:DNA gyrase inhibitor YacG [Sandaracinobacter sp. RS1-74]|uniref:DNA gyrase inhibitor YacG n=1 Tax=Sandaracinobacteroides sayramensis TaxID=2913411 RepID=UPI001EDBC019|nr:DNA gyrase inhibitor YacG [Sandaracinobacteroides sayramensis]MCG2841924.1 DNA gyrase inhibitor YacG [Sandaracinobacteroides sayramensis]